ncbi:hypothetical protein ACN4EK_13225 [Pantanalinema rosaneae CENA516]|uniref:hypothetical protein n=1 Tax=Pantanalinema rosaneae TaxID=1620701 RepID=UPI003D6DFD2F
MSSLEQMQQDIQALPEEAQLLLMDFIEILKKRYPQVDQSKANAEGNPYEKFKESGFIGCVSVGENLSATEGLDRRAFMKLPMAERQRILATQAAAMSEHYEQDTAWQEWVNLDVEATYDES